MKAKELDRRFDEGEDVSGVLDLGKARRPGQEQRRVNVDFPVWMIESLDRDRTAKRLIRRLKDLGLNVQIQSPA